MLKNLKILIVLAAVSLFMVSCGSKEEASSGSFARAKIPAPAPVAEPASADIFDSSELDANAPRRNPFLSFIVINRDANKVVKIRGPLECCELNLFRLVAVVLSSESSYALVESPDKKRYIVRRGDLIGAMEGKITRINAKSIIVREYDRDVSGKIISTNDEELRLPLSKKTGR